MCIRDRVAAIEPQFQYSYKAMLEIDVLLAKARLALDMKAFKPTVRTDTSFSLIRARHPVSYTHLSPQPSPRPSTSSSSGPRRPRKARTDMKKKISAGTLTRTAVLGLALANQLLSAAGKPLLPIDNAQLEQMISTGFTVGAALAAWWKNNSFTSEAIEADAFMARMKKSVH